MSVTGSHERMNCVKIHSWGKRNYGGEVGYEEL